MHPALSIILFTTASGAGYGLLALCGVLAELGLAIAASGLALALIVPALLASMLHLGRPERAWRAFSQWRSSWLSREGVASVLTFAPALAFAAAWYVQASPILTGLLGLLASAASLATVACTAMIYASLKPIRQWNNG